MEKSRKALRILLVEDSPDDAELVRLKLAESGHVAVIQQVGNRAELEDCLTQTSWDLIISDHNLPSMDSLEALQVVIDLGITAPFVILSGSIPDDQAIEAMRRGARDFIHKSALGKLIPVIERELVTADMSRELQRLSTHVELMADFDLLTGLPNRENLLRYLAQRVERNREADASFCLLLLDINRFRQFGHTLGPSFGNQIIAEVARRIAVSAGAANFVARIGGSSFALVAHNLDSDASIQAFVARICEATGHSLHAGPHELFISLNVGASCFPRDAGSAEQIFANAQTALFHAKGPSGNTLRIFHPAMAGKGIRGIAIEGALHRALKNREFVLHYQPQIDLASGRIVSVEALIRWRHPEWGLVAPSEFIPLLEETGLIVPVGEWILSQACAQLHAWDKAGHAPLRMAVNLSALQFGDARLTDIVASTLQYHAIEPDRFELEITESIVMEGKEDAILALRALRQLGVRIAVDDFGTGYSSLGYLKRFPITTLKIDRMFVHECADNPQDQALVETMIGMAHRLNLDVIAEGVETARQVDFLTSQGCDIAQGYYYGKPMPAEELFTLLSRSRISGCTVSRNAYAASIFMAA